MPNRDHDDSPYNRNEGRYESPDERDYDRSRASRDWDRRDDFRSADRYRSQQQGNQYGSGYNPARDDNDYRGGSRTEGSFGAQNRNFQGARAWDDESRGSNQGWNYQQARGSEWGRSDSDDWRPEFQRSATLRGGWNQQRPYAQQGNFGQGNFGQGNFGASRGAFSPAEYGTYGGQDWNRDYTRDWDRDYRGDDARRSAYHRGGSEGSDWGEEIRHAGRSFVGKVKRAFRGPKGYKRSDERIREDVNDRLSAQDEFDPSEIEVRVENGDVTLTGSVRNRHEKFRAEEIADDVNGVNEVHNQLRIGSAQTSQTASTTTGTTTSSTSTPVSRNGRA